MTRAEALPAKEKRALDFPPEFTTRAFFYGLPAPAVSSDFPPEIIRNYLA
jgi:hypothetical protein